MLVILKYADIATRWNSWVPIKLNVFMWRIRLGRIPTRDNLSTRGMKIDSILFLVFHSNLECLYHIFINCPLLKEIWGCITSWLSFDFLVELTVMGFISWANSIGGF